MGMLITSTARRVRTTRSGLIALFVVLVSGLMILNALWPAAPVFPPGASVAVKVPASLPLVDDTRELKQLHGLTAKAPVAAVAARSVVAADRYAALKSAQLEDAGISAPGRYVSPGIAVPPDYAALKPSRATRPGAEVASAETPSERYQALKMRQLDRLDNRPTARPTTLEEQIAPTQRAAQQYLTMMAHRRAK